MWVPGNCAEPELERWPDPDMQEIFTLHGNTCRIFAHVYIMLSEHYSPLQIDTLPNRCSCDHVIPKWVSQEVMVYVIPWERGRSVLVVCLFEFVVKTR